MTTKDLNRIAETAEAARRVGEKVEEIWTRRNALVAICDAKDPHAVARACIQPYPGGGQTP